MFVRSLLAISFIAWSTIPASRADPAQPNTATPSPSQSSTLTSRERTVLNYGSNNKTCVTWSDGCISCKRADGEQGQCSNIGIVCQPGEIRCLEPK
jgi:hypothetical protein